MSEYLVVLSILEGRKFPKREKCKLEVEALFDGELVQTDPTDHHNDPEFNTELTWLLDKKSLQMHRLQRSPLKIHCHALLENGQKELLGYVIIDIRLALEDALPPKWYPILNSKYKKQKPELLIGLCLERHDSDQFMSQVNNDNSEVKVNMGQSKNVLDDLQLNENEGLYEIGNQQNSEIFSISVTIACAQNVNALFSNTSVIDTSSGLFFYYSLLGNDVTTDTFENCSNPEFLAERASLKFKCTENNLWTFLESIPYLQIYLCCGDVTSGRAEIPFSALTKGSSSHLNVQPKTLDGLYELKKLGEDSSADDSVKSYVGVSICLRKETSKKQAKKLPKTSSNFFSSTKQNVSKNDALITSTNILGQKYRFCFTLDLRKISVYLEPQLHCSLRYVYPFFGTYEPITSHPIFEVNSNVAVTIPQGYCMFNFASSQKLLYDTLNSIPIVVELYNHNHNKMELIGTSSISLGPVLDAKSKPVTNDKGLTGIRKLHTCSSILQSSQMKKNIGDIFIVMALDDFGVLGDNEIKNLRSEKMSVADSDNLNKKVLENFSEPNPDFQNFKKATTSNSAQRAESLSQEAALQMAIELEAWKEQQQILFHDQLKEKEQKHLAALSSEWISRDKEREQLLHKKIKDHELVENKLRESLSDVEKRQKKLQNYEQEVLSLKLELKQQKEHLTQANMDSVKRVQDEYKLNVLLERNKNEDLIKRIQIITEERDKLLQKLKLKEKEFENYKDDLKLKPEIKLQNQLDIMNLEKVELERKLESSLKSKIHYKQQWGRALRELSRIKQIQQEQAKLQLQRQQQELEMLRMQHITGAKQSSLEAEKKVLQDIQAELTKLKEEVRPDDAARETGEEEIKEHLKSDHVRMLENERKTLLKTGVYTMQDKIIMDMNRNIQEAMLSFQQS